MNSFHESSLFPLIGFLPPKIKKMLTRRIKRTEAQESKDDIHEKKPAKSEKQVPTDSLSLPWLAELLASTKDKLVLPVLVDRAKDFDQLIEIPDFLKPYHYWYGQGSHVSEATRYFILPDEFVMYGMNFADGKRVKTGPVTIGELRDPMHKNPQLLFYEPSCAHNSRVKSIRDIYLGYGPGPDTFCELFCSSNYAYGYKPDHLQIRLNKEIVVCQDFGTPIVTGK